MKCKFCGAEVKLGERCQYCGSVAEEFYYKPEEPPEVVGRNQTDRKEYTVQIWIWTNGSEKKNQRQQVKN